MFFIVSFLPFGMFNKTHVFVYFHYFSYFYLCMSFLLMTKGGETYLRGRLVITFYIPKFLTKNPNIAIMFLLTTTSMNSLLNVLQG